MTLKPITCSRCKANIGYYDTITGCLIIKGQKTRIFGAFLPCHDCNSLWKHDGMKLKKLEQRRRREVFILAPPVLLSA